MKGWQVMAHHDAPVPADWHARLCERLQQRPRRIGSWAELALYGARACLDAAGEGTLPPGAMLWLATLAGPAAAAKAALDQAAGTGMPKPFSFLQSQPSQTLSALCQHLAWRGDARFVVSRDRDALLRLARPESGPDGLLLGWVDEALEPGAPPRSEWWRLRPAEAP